MRDNTLQPLYLDQLVDDLNTQNLSWADYMAGAALVDAMEARFQAGALIKTACCERWIGKKDLHGIGVALPLAGAVDTEPVAYAVCKRCYRDLDYMELGKKIQANVGGGKHHG